LKRLLLFGGLAIAIMILAVGCDADSRGAKVSPKTMPDTMGDNEYAEGGSTADDERWYNETIDEVEQPLELITVRFNYDSHKLTSEAIGVMNENAEALMTHPNAVIQIAGHCDERGTEEYNLALGEKRARSVLEYLTQYGIEAGRLSLISYGESIPEEYGSNENSWVKNRRAEFAIISK